MSFGFVPLFLVVNASFAASLPEHKAPLHVDAKERIECHRKENRCIARGDVRVREGDKALNADKVTFLFTPDTSKPLQELESIEATGDVHLHNKDQKARARFARYAPATHSFRLEGAPVVVHANGAILKTVLVQGDGPKGEILMPFPLVVQKEGRRLTCDRGRLLVKRQNDRSFKVHQFIGEGHVRLEERGVGVHRVRQASGDRVLYDFEKEEGRLSAATDVVLIQDGNVARGELLLFGKEEVTLVPASGGRVSLLIERGKA